MALYKLYYLLTYLLSNYTPVIKTRKLSYRKDDRAMRPMYAMGARKIFGSP